MTNKKERIYIGIDPGKTGALAFLAEDGGISDIAVMMPSLDELTRLALWCRKHDAHVTIEDPEPNYGWGIKGMKTLFENLGQLKALFPDAQLVNPKVWQSAIWTPDSFLAVPKGKQTAKKRSLYVAEQHWKHCTFRPENTPGSPKDGIVDAHLIALYGIMTKRGKFHS